MKKTKITVAIATPPIKVGNISSNATDIIKVLDSSNADVVLFPELNLTSLYCGDLFRNRDFLSKALEEAKRIINETKFTGMFTIGLPLRVELYTVNVLLIINNKKIVGFEQKVHLSLSESRFFDNFTCKDIARYIFDGEESCKSKIYLLDEVKIRFTIDNYNLENTMVDKEVNILLNASGDYEVLDSGYKKVESVLYHSYTNRFFYGYSSPSKLESTSKYVYSGDMIFALNGSLLDEASNLYDDIDYLEIELDTKEIIETKHTLNTDVYKTLYLDKVLDLYSPFPFLEGKSPNDVASVVNILLVAALSKKILSMPPHLRKIIIGVSGGADSTLALLISEQALEQLDLPSTDLIAVSMPSVNSSINSSKRAIELIDGVKATKMVIPIDEQLNVHLKSINHQEKDVVYENAQARIRTNILMDLANKYGGFVIGPSDLSEIALGFSTYNGDASSMYGINQGIPKTLVLTVLEYLSKEIYLDLSQVIYDISKTKPSPELLKDQVTEEIVGRYDINDYILYHFIKHQVTKEDFIELLPKVFNISIEVAKVYVDRFFKRFFQSQFKRVVSPEGPNVLDFTLNPCDGFVLTGDNEVEY